jgi:hypothetical protein
MKKGHAIPLSVLVWVGLFLSGCTEKEPTKEMVVPRPDLEALIGEWQLVESAGGYGGQRITASAGHTETLIFGADGCLQHQLNNKLLQQGLYQTRINPDQAGENRLLSLYLNKPAADTKEALFRMEWAEQQLYFQHTDTLLISPRNVDDGFAHVLVRRLLIK